MTPLRFGSLFTGIGGLDLGLERAGMSCAWQVEIDPACQRVLAKHWPNVPKWGDIRGLTGGDLEPVDLICGGFPCQPVSLAGGRLGQDDPRWLWPEYARIIRMVGPRYVLVENVPGLLTANRGAAFAEVLGDLADLGYDAEWDCLPAAALGAPQLRYRVFLVAYAQEQPLGAGLCQGEQAGQRRGRSGDGGGTQHVAHPDRERQQEREQPLPSPATVAGLGSTGVVANTDRAQRGALPKGRHDAHGDDAGWEEATGGPGVGRQAVFAGRPGPVDFWAVEPPVGRVAHGLSGRVDRLAQLGNAVVPQVAEWVGRCIVAHAARKEQYLVLA